MPIWTPPNFEFGLASNRDAGRAANASFARSRLVQFIITV
jgi:hypothetical protein